MKKMLYLIILSIILNASRVLAVDNSISVRVEGKWKKGNNIRIIIDSDISEKIYSGQIIIDSDEIKINNILPGKLLNNDNIQKISFNGTQKNNINYYFTCLGDERGFEGKGELFIVNAIVLNNKENLKNDNISIKLYSRNSNINEIKYTLNNSIKNNNISNIYMYDNLKKIIVSLLGASLLSIIYVLYKKRIFNKKIGNRIKEKKK